MPQRDDKPCTVQTKSCKNESYANEIVCMCEFDKIN